MKKKRIVLKDYFEEVGTVYVQLDGTFSFHIEPLDEAVMAVFKEGFSTDFLPGEVHRTIIPIQFVDPKAYDLLTAANMEYLCKVARQQVENAFEEYVASDSLYFDLQELSKSISEVISDLGAIAILLSDDDYESEE